MPDFPQRRKSIPLVTDLAMALAANKRSTGVPAARTTLNDEELVFFLKNKFILFIIIIIIIILIKRKCMCTKKLFKH